MDADEMLRRVAAKLGQLDRRLVYLGGAVTQRLITDPAAPKPTATADVDVVIDITSRAEYLSTLREELRGLGAKEDTSEDAPLCRWIVDSITTDIMPVAQGVLGFGNPWYSSAMASAVAVHVGETEVLITDAPHFVATKMAAFNDRGAGDFLGSKDVEDVIAVVDGRAELASEVDRAPAPLRAFARASFADWLRSQTFEYAVEGYLRDEDDRIPIVLSRVSKIAGKR